MEDQFVIGLDFGTDSVRALLVNAVNGQEISSHVHDYKKWLEGEYCVPEKNQFRQHPFDHIEGMESTIKNVIKTSGIDPALIKGICIDTTGSSPMAVDRSGKSLAFHPDFADNPNAMMILWKDHTSIGEAQEINDVSRKWPGVDYTRYVGGIYSSEWFWSKILHVIRQDEKLKLAAWSWMEHCDYLTYLLVGEPLLDTFKRSRCAAGHKAMWHESWGGLPADDYLAKFDPYLKELKSRLYTDTFTSDQPAGNLCQEWADRTGLSTDTIVAVGTFDAHAGAVGAGIQETSLVRVMGTSTCDILVAEEGVVGDKTVKGICGQVDGSVVPGMIGLEAGQSAFGDVLAWFRDVLAWPLENLNGLGLSEEQVQEARNSMIEKLSSEAEKIPPSETAPIALDWINGRRTPDANQALKAGFVNLSLGTKAPHMFRALVESICFGSRKIVERFEDEGVDISSVVGIGGVARKSGFIMQTLADVLNMPIKISKSDQAPALGAAMYAAVAAGIYDNLDAAIKRMGSGFEKTYHPRPEVHALYDRDYLRYEKFGEFVENEINN